MFLLFAVKIYKDTSSYEMKVRIIGVLLYDRPMDVIATSKGGYRIYVDSCTYQNHCAMTRNFTPS